MPKFLNKDGVQHLMSYVDGEYPNNDILIAALNAIDKTISEIPQSDWNQNDETAKDYIKNRPFYEEIIESENVFFDGQHDFSTGELSIDYSFFEEVGTGNQIIITINGVNYTATVNYQGRPVYSYYLENFSEGCPLGDDWNGSLSDKTGELGNVSIKISALKSNEIIIHHLDKKYIPYVAGQKTEHGGEIFNSYEGNSQNVAYECAHAEGDGTTASGRTSHAEGLFAKASGEISHAEGDSTEASGEGSHVEGYFAKAIGDYSHAEGTGTTAHGENQHVQGKHNIDDVDSEGNALNTYAHIVGNGNANVHSNAHTLDWDGKAWFAGDVYVGSASGTNMDEGSKKLVTEDKLSDYYLKTEADTLHSELHDYVDTEVAALVNAAPETLDTLGELATAFNDNKEVVEALDASITNKVDKTYLSEFENELKAYVVEAIYGIVDGTIENISNAKATYVRDYGFYKHPSLVSASFANATKIGDYGFYQCPYLFTVDAPLVTEIGAFAFRGCSSLTNITSSAITITGNGIFDECTNLSSVALANLQEVKPLTFRKCESLTSVDLPVVTNIGTQAFYSSGITSLTLRSNTVVTLENADAFYFTPIEEGTGYIYVPSNLVDSYKTADGWSTYANQIRAIV